MGLEIELDDLGGFFRRRLKPPILDQLHARLYENRVTTKRTGVLYAAIRGDNDLDSDLATDSAPSSELGV